MYDKSRLESPVVCRSRLGLSFRPPLARLESPVVCRSRLGLSFRPPLVRLESPVVVVHVSSCRLDRLSFTFEVVVHV